MDTVASAAVKYLGTLADVTALLGAYPSTDTINAGKPFVFGGDIGYTMQGTGAVALVCQNFGTYTTAPDLTTWMAFRLAVVIWVDPARDSGNNIIESSITTQSRGHAVFTKMNFHLHRTNGDRQQWGDMLTTSSRLLTGPQFVPAEDSGAVARGMSPGTTSHPQIGVAYYGVTVFGYTDAVS